MEKNNWRLSGEVGVVPGFLLTGKMQTYHGNGSEMETFDFLTMKLRSRLLAVQIGLAAEYHVSKYLSLILSPGWRQYFNGINKETLSTKLGLFQAAFRIQYSF